MSTLLRAVGLNGRALERHGATTVAAFGLAAVAAVTAAIFLGYAVLVTLADRMNPAAAALVVSAGAALIAVGCVAWARQAVARAKRDVTRAVQSSALVALGTPALALARRNIGLAGVVVALGTGFWLARRSPNDEGQDG